MANVPIGPVVHCRTIEAVSNPHALTLCLGSAAGIV